jgi:hypothetical protein
MKRLQRINRLLLAAGAVLAIVSCSDDDDYGMYPAILTEMVELHSNDQGHVYEMLTDNDSLYAIKQTITSVPNTYYRCMVQYTTDGTYATIYNSITRVSVLRDSTGVAVAGRDAIAPRSMWMSGNGRYLNMSFTVQGRNETHYYGYRIDSTGTTVQGKGITYLSLYHNRNNDPESYSITQYASIQLSQVSGLDRGDSLYMDVTTATGRVRRGFTY